MKLPGGSRAIVERQKLTDYCLDPSHPRGKHKARVFSSVLGFTADDAERLAEALLAAAATGEAQQGIVDTYRPAVRVRFRCERPARDRCGPEHLDRSSG